MPIMPREHIQATHRPSHVLDGVWHSAGWAVIFGCMRVSSRGKRYSPDFLGRGGFIRQNLMLGYGLNRPATKNKPKDDF